MISGIALTAHSQRGRSCSRVCVTWSPTLSHPTLYIPFMWYVGQTLHLGSTGDEGSLTPAALDFRMISLIAPECRKRPHLSYMYTLLYAIVFVLSSPVLPLPPPLPPRRSSSR